MTTTGADVLTKLIGDEMVSIIKAQAGSLSLKVVQLGDPQRLASVPVLNDFLPGVFVKPEQVVYAPLDASGTEYRVGDVFRILYAYSMQDVSTAVYDQGADGLRVLCTALNTDAHLSNISATIRPDQIEQSNPADVDWNPDEDEFLFERSVPIKIVMLRWTVQWLARRSS